jgi:hypothetical protein
MVNVPVLHLHEFLTLALNGGECLASRLSRFIPVEGTPERIRYVTSCFFK